MSTGGTPEESQSPPPQTDPVSGDLPENGDVARTGARGGSSPGTSTSSNSQNPSQGNIETTVGFIAWLLQNVGDIVQIMATALVILFSYYYIGMVLQPLIWLVLTLLVYISFFVARSIFFNMEGGIIGTLYQIIGARSLYICSIICILLLVATTVTSAIFGFPNDLRWMVNPAVVRRASFPSEGIELSRHNGDELSQRLLPWAPRAGKNADDEKRRLVWEEWMFKGATGKGIEVVVYTSQPQGEFYGKTDAHIEFDKLPATAVLADCVGFITNASKRSDSDSLRSIDIAGLRFNSDSSQKNKLSNIIHGLMLDHGDTIVIIAQFIGVPPNTPSTAVIKPGLPVKAEGASEPAKK